ncbi:hypothetical protein HanRHA438_Chr08g0342021 [Helianthus annuus]|nr:hypothetical protein HanRHA438_Chr08g0342021 [Helianthus annuus]
MKIWLTYIIIIIKAIFCISSSCISICTFLQLHLNRESAVCFITKPLSTPKP